MQSNNYTLDDAVRILSQDVNGEKKKTPRPFDAIPPREEVDEEILERIRPKTVGDAVEILSQNVYGENVKTPEPISFVDSEEIGMHIIRTSVEYDPETGEFSSEAVGITQPMDRTDDSIEEIIRDNDVYSDEALERYEGHLDVLNMYIDAKFR